MRNASGCTGFTFSFSTSPVSRVLQVVMGVSYSL
jgi:hypothetical protein